MPHLDPSLTAPRLATSTTAPLREVRRRLRERLAGIAERVGALTTLPPGGRRTAMEQVVADLEANLRPHLEWEEATIHPMVDKFACEGPAAFSTSMRYEHLIIYRWLGELGRQATDAAAVVAFSRRADNLLGIVQAHFELEEEVLFPILDRAMAGGSQQPIGTPPCEVGVFRAGRT